MTRAQRGFCSDGYESPGRVGHATNTDMTRVLVLLTLVAAVTGCDRKREATGSAPAAGAAATGAPAAAGAPVARTAKTEPGDGAAKPGPAPAGTAQADATATLAHPLLWSVEKAGTTTYFLGTMHIGIDAASQLPPLVWSKLDAARAFAMEANLDDPEAAKLFTPSAASLHDALGDDYWARLEGAIGRGPARAIDHLPPLVPAAALSMRGLPETPPMDKVLSERAAAAHKPMVYLEPATRQLALLRKWMDLKALKMMLDELPEGEKHAHAMLDAYAAGDEARILALAGDERSDALQHGYTAAEYDQEMEDLLYGRNASWISAIERLHAEGGGFVAVGALHLVGPRSVLDLLSHKGYRVTRIAP